MNKHILIIILFSSLSCQKEKQLTIDDLIFPDAYRQSIIDNNVESVTFRKNIDPFYIDLYLHELEDGKIIFDSLGRIIKHEQHEVSKSILELAYESKIFINRRATDSDYYSEDNYKNLFISDSLTMITHFSNYINESKIPLDHITNYYKFNENGYLFFEFQEGQIDFRPYTHHTIEYNYNKDLKISSLKTNYLLSQDEYDLLQAEKPNNWKTYYPKTKFDTIFYNGNKITHQNTEIQFVINKNPLQINTFYDDRGLKVKSVIQDSIIMTYNYTYRKVSN